MPLTFDSQRQKEGTSEKNHPKLHLYNVEQETPSGITAPKTGTINATFLGGCTMKHHTLTTEQVTAYTQFLRWEERAAATVEKYSHGTRNKFLPYFTYPFISL